MGVWRIKESGSRDTPNMARMKIPSHVIQTDADTGGVPSDADAIDEEMAAEDKTLGFMTGNHYLTEPDQAREEVADRMAGWVSHYCL